MKMNAFKDVQKHIVTTRCAEFQMTIKYLKDVSTMLPIVSVVREGDLKRRFSAKREILKSIFAFDNIKYARYNTYQHAHSGI